MFDDVIIALLVANGAELVKLKRALLLNGPFVQGYDPDTHQPTRQWPTDTKVDYDRLVDAIRSVTEDFTFLPKRDAP